MALKARVHIETALRSERTVLKKSFCDAPFKLADITENKQQKELQLMLMSSSPGMLDGDEYTFAISLAKNTSLNLQTQSNQRIFQMKVGAVQTMNVWMEKGASLVYTPHPSVPHKDACFTSQSKINLSEGCSLTWGEIISCGRTMNKEVFQFTSYHSVTEIFFNGRLRIKENLFFKPLEMNMLGIGHMEGFTHQASFLYVNEKSSVNDITQSIVDYLEMVEGISFGVSALPVNGIVVRLLGYKAEQLFALLKCMAIRIQSQCKIIPAKTEAYV